MKTFQFDKLLQNDGWQSNCFVTVDAEGTITSLSSEQPDGEVEHVSGYGLPGFQNAHSHAFQYAMAGLAEIHPDPTRSDDFWSWRTTMYQIALSIGPEQLESVASMLYSEMLRHGYTHVAEFHYLHHDPFGNSYANLSEMGERLIAAAKKTGMHITLVPMLYQMGGFGKQPQDGQRRFISSTLDDYQMLLSATQQSIKSYDYASLGVGFHSLRAVNKETVRTYFDQEKSSLPFHIHISEQLKEVNECMDLYGARPVEWLLENAPVNARFHLVHATHLTEKETTDIANSGAHVVICPSTEGNLGDGIFPLKPFMNAGGKWSIGTDSHIGLSPMEELRILDYGQRLISHQRNQFITSTNGNSGHVGFDMALQAGRAAMGHPGTPYFAVGQSLDAIVMDSSHPLILTSSSPQLLSTLIYAGDPSFILGTITHGQWQVKNGRHLKAEDIANDFGRAMKQIGVRD